MNTRGTEFFCLLFVFVMPHVAANDDLYVRWSAALEFPTGMTIEYRLATDAAIGIYSIGSEQSDAAFADEYYSHPGYNYKETVYGIRYAHMFGDGNHRAELNFSVQAERHQLRYHNGEPERSAFEYGYALGMGYRYEPVDGGFQFRAGLLHMHELNDVDLDDRVVFVFEDLFEEGTWPYLSAGWAF